MSGAAVPRATPAARDRAIDCLKGAAILAVLCIHADVLAGRRVMTHLLNHAVPVFVVLFGVNAEQWWRRRGEPPLATWYADRARRLYPPLWAAVALWWAVALAARPLWLHPTWRQVALNLAGVLPNVGTGWFVTLILQLVAVQPLLHRAARRVGMGPVLAAGFACLVGGIALRPWIVWWLGFWGATMFAFRLLGHVAFGMWLAPRLGALDARAGIVAGAAAVACAAAQEALVPHPSAAYAERLLDLPLTVALLVAFRPLAAWDAVARPLAWLGVHSYGVYLAQAVVHDAALLALGPRGPYEKIGPWPYLALLLAGAVALVAAGNAARDALDAVVARARRR